MHIKKGDTVEVLAGKDRGKTGKVMRVIPKKNRILVEGVNKFKRHVKKTNDHPGGIIELERTIHASNVKVVEK